jgi:hypothetical protein
LCGTVVVAGLVVTRPGFSIDNTGAVPIEEQRSTCLTADVELAYPWQLAPLDSAAVCDVHVALEPGSVTGTARDSSAASDQPESITEAASPPPMQVATASRPDPLPNKSQETESSNKLPDDCLLSDICIDRYLWALYQRTPKEDTNKVHERKKVTVKKKGKKVIVTKTVTRLVDADFSWKDPKAAEKAGMPMMDYVLGGMDRGFKVKLFQALRAAEEAGLSPGITSAFRDDYRQSIASGLKAAIDRSYHGGSFRGGYGHGLAADVVSVKGTTREQRWISTESLWKWIDEHGKDFGIGRPYVDRDPPHLAPIDGKEYADHHRDTRVQRAASAMKKRNRVAVRDDHAVAKVSKKPKLLQRS